MSYEELRRENEALAAQVEALTYANADLQRLLDSSDGARREATFRRVIAEAPIPVFLHDEKGRVLQISRAVTALTGYTPDDIPTRDAWIERAYGEGGADARETLDRLYSHGESVEGREFRVRTKTGAYRVWQFSSALLDPDEQGRRLALSMAADVTERKQAEAEREAHARQQHVVAALGLYALSEPDLSDLFERAVHAAQETLGTDGTKVLELTDDGHALRLRTGLGWRDGLVGTATVPNDASSQAGFTLRQDRPVIVRDFAAEDRFSCPDFLASHGIESGMSVIIGSPERPFGVLGTHARTPRAYTDADADFLQAIANVLGSAVRRFEAQRQIRDVNAQLEASNQELERRVGERTESLRTSEARLRTLYDVISRPTPNAYGQIDDALEKATELLGLQAGLLSRITEDAYEIVACYAPGTDLKAGETFPLAETCCALTIAQDRPLAIAHLSASEYVFHPCVRPIPAESYLGVPVRVDARVSGTLSFSSTVPRSEPFPEAEREFVSLLARWFGAALARERADTQLARSEHLLAGVLLGSVDGIAALDAVRDENERIVDFEWTLVNPAAAETFHAPAAELIGRSYLERFPAAEDIFEAMAEVVETAVPFHREVCYETGTIAGWFAISAVKLGDGIAMTFRDITERKQTEQALRESEARFRELFENSPDAIFVEDLAGVVVDVNPAACRLHRADRAWLVGRSVLDLVPPDYRDRVMEDFEQLASGETALLESYSFAKDGTAIPVEVRTDRITYGGEDAVLLHVRDIMERHAAERALKESEERFAKAFHASPVAVTIATIDEERYLDANESFCALTGYARNVVIGRTPSELGLLPRPLEQTLVLDALQAGRSVREVEIEVRTKNGDLRDVLVSAEPIELGGARCILGIGFDVTERKRLEREVIEATELERRRIGQDLHDELGQQLTGAAFLGKVLQQKLAAKNVDEADDAARLTSLITDALAETRDLSHLLSPVDIQAEGLMDALQELADQTERVFGVSCLLDIEGDVRLADNAAATHLFRIAQEAVNNAVKHAAPSTITVHLVRTNDALELTVRDDGSGFASDTIQRPTGLGLRTMRYRAALIGATLAIESDASGSRVVVYLPAPAR